MSSDKNKKKKIRIKPLPVIILLAVVAVATASIIILSNSGKKEKNETEVNINNAGILNPTKGTDAVSTTVKIEMKDCSLPVGTTLIATAVVTPEGTETGINWSSSNEAVLTVDSEGVITVKGRGMAALTATIGTSSDAVLIEGILQSADSSGTNGGLSNGNNGNANGGNNGGANIGNNGNTNSGNNGNGGNNGGNTNNGNGTDNGDNGAAGGTGDGGNNSGGLPEPTQPITPTKPASNGLTSKDLHPVLSEVGYSKRYSDVYLFEDGDNYYGEIIIQSDLVIIYIKQRNGELDSKIQHILMQLLPEQGRQVWNNYTASSGDRTFTAEGRMVRMVSAGKGGHSQIVIYN